MVYNIVIFSLASWNIDYGSNIKDISLALSKNHRVLYVDVPLKRKERYLPSSDRVVGIAKERIASKRLLQKINDNLWHYIPEEVLESVNSLKNNWLFDILVHINNRRFAKSLRKVIREVGFEQFILLNDNNIYEGLHLKKLLGPSQYVYYLRDKLAAMKYWKRQVTRCEPMLIQRVDMVVANSEYLAEYARNINPHSYYVGQGCDITQFLKRVDPQAVDKALNGIPRPIVGYTGALNAERLDIALMVKLAKRLPDISFVLVGQEDTTFLSCELHRLKNVFFMGQQEFEDLPIFLNGFEVTFNPQVLNEITVGNYPRKIDEYLAVGKPVVATATKAMIPFKDYVYLCDDIDDYEKAIRQAISEDNDERRRARIEFASSHTWENNVRLILESIEMAYGR